MDVSTFKKEDFKNVTIYWKAVGSYELCVSVGLGASHPSDKDLDINAYSIVLVDICNSDRYTIVRGSDKVLDELMSNFCLVKSKNSNHHTYCIPVSELERMHDALIGRRTCKVYTPASLHEGPCKHCGKMNDLGVPSCWFCTTLDPTA